MRFSLRNRPRWNKEFSLDELQDYALDCYEWFVGFEKELREKIKDFENAEKNPLERTTIFGKGHTQALREVLGEG